jgi:signal transduction histidine kinase
MKFYFILICFCFSFFGNAQITIRLNEPNKLIHIGKKTSHLNDPQFLTIDQILDKENQLRFRPYDQDAPNFGPINEAVWFKFEVANEVDDKFFLQIGSAYIDSLALYKVVNGKVVESMFTGDNYPFSSRHVKVATFIYPLNIAKDSIHTYYLRSKTNQPFFFLLRVGTLKSLMEDAHILDFVQGIYLGIMVLILFYNIFLYFSIKEKVYLWYSFYVISITWFMSTIFQYVFEYLWPSTPIINDFAVASSAMTIFTATLFTRSFLNTAKFTPRLHKISSIFIVVSIVIFILVFSPYKIPALMLAQLGILLMAIYFLITGISILRKGYKPAKFYLFAWIFLIIGFVAAILESVNILPVLYYVNWIQIGSVIEVTLLSFALADRINMYKKEREEAQILALKVAEQQNELIQKQNIILEEKVNERTIDLKKSFEDLKATQALLIQNEKMASFGELTAGIAHEIQNPLNFVNNFSELSVDLSNELKEELTKLNLDKQDKDNVIEIIDLLSSNQEKINHHGRRAADIVKGMLHHSRSSTGKKELSNINDVVEEYLKLAYHGLRTKPTKFTFAIKSILDPSIPEISIISQDIGRVILNLITNAFHAVAEEANKEIEGYEPSVSVSTKAIDAKWVEITVKDNGGGIPDDIKDKIFQPFFTTKPSGEGTGLGLSLAYDIVKAHGGEIRVVSNQDEGTSFIIQLPITS